MDCHKARILWYKCYTLKHYNIHLRSHTASNYITCLLQVYLHICCQRFRGQRAADGVSPWLQCANSMIIHKWGGLWKHLIIHRGQVMGDAFMCQWTAEVYHQSLVQVMVSGWPLKAIDYTLGPDDTYMRQWTGSSLVQVMACCLGGTKPLPEPMMTYCQFDPWEQTLVKYESNHNNFYSRKYISKCHLQNGSHFSILKVITITYPHPVWPTQVRPNKWRWTI